MATEVFKILGQEAPGTTTTALYTVPTGKSAVISTIAVCNQTATDATFRIATQRAADASTSTILTKQYIAYGSTVAANDTTFVTIGATLAAGDQIIVYGSSSSISFNAYGSEVTP